MNRVYLKNFGIYHQHAKNSAELTALVASGATLNADEQDYYQTISPELINKRLVSREDRAVLSCHSKMVLNALSDLAEKQDLSALSEATLYSACDSEEHDFSTLREIVNRAPSEFWQNMMEMNKLNNPLEMLRLLSTNPLYHISKVLKNHSEGVPLRSASLSGLSALKQACADIAYHSAKSGALIVSSANMLSFNSVVAFNKFGEIRHSSSQQSGIIPSWGGVAVHLDHNPANALAEVLAVPMHYQPLPKFAEQSWLALLKTVNDAHGAPDVIISYENGIAAQSEGERAAIYKVFPDVPVINYKCLTGYGGKINNLIDMACAISDTRIKAGARVLFNGAGIMHGLGCALLQKMRRS